MKHRPTKRKGSVLTAGGLLLLAAALALIIYNVWDESRAARSVNATLEQIQVGLSGEVRPSDDPAVIPDYILNPNMDMPVQTIGGVDYIGTLEIPAIELVLPIASQWSYPALKKAPCRYAGSAYLDDMVIAGHNYRSHFAGLRTLSLGDVVYFTDMDGNRFTYRVASMETLAADAVEEMTDSGWPLSLFTCTVSGRQRMTIRCERAGVT